MSMCNRVGFMWKVVGEMSGWLCSSVVECSHGQRKALRSSPGRATIFHLLHMYVITFYLNYMYSIIEMSACPFCV